MLKSARCTSCHNKHHDHYICDQCLGTIGGFILDNFDWKFCPFCGKELYPPNLNRNQRREFADALYRGEQP